MLDDVQVGLRGQFAVQAGIDDAAARFDGGKIPEIVGGFKRIPGCVHRNVQLRFVE